MSTKARLLFVAIVSFSTLSVFGASQRTTVVISDLHFGYGFRLDEWDVFEDFRWDNEWRSFLDHVGTLSGGRVTLVVAGDMFELWQSHENDCQNENRNLGCTQAEALERVRRTLDGHKKEFEALRAFANALEHQVVIVPGNHDAGLLFSDVADEVIRTIGAQPGRVTISSEGHWLSPDKKIYVEHGQQIGHDVNRFDAWPKPFLSGGKHLQRTWGERFVQQFYNDHEKRYPAIDNISNNGGVGLGIAAEGAVGTTFATGRFLRYYVTDVSWRQFVQSLGEDGQIKYDVEHIRRVEGDRFFYESLTADDPLRAVAEQAYLNGTLGVSIHDLTDDEIRSVCEIRRLIAADELANGKHKIKPCPGSELGAVGALILHRSIDRKIAKRIEEVTKVLKKSRPPFNLFVYGHTHSAKPASNPMAAIGRSNWDVTVLNSGAWQRIAATDDIRRIRCGRPAAEFLRKLRPEDLPACYPTIIIPPYATRPSGDLRFWTAEAGEWQLRKECAWIPPNCPEEPRR